MAGNSIALRWAAAAGAVMVAVCVVAAVAAARGLRREQMRSLVDRASLVATQAVATTQRLRSVDVDAAHGIAAEVASTAATQEGMRFRVTAFGARPEWHPQQDPELGSWRTDLLQSLQQQVQAGGSVWLWRLSDSGRALHYLRAVDLGEPGAFGAYEVVVPTAAPRVQISAFVWQLLPWLVPSLAVGCLLLLLLARSLLQQPVTRFVAELAQMTDGPLDLGRRLDFASGDEIARVADSFDRFVDRVHETVLDAANACSEVDESARVIAGEAQRLTESNAENAATIAALRTTLAAIGDLSSEASTSCGNATAGIERQRSAVTQGSTEVERMTAAMAAIDESSRAITSIVQVVQDVAFESNLLALNAAVEAARAGDAGRGFAVVADEVRRLAQRSAAAATEAGKLIEQACQRAVHGGQITGVVTCVLGQIDAETARVGGLLADAVAAVARQDDNMSQVMRGLDQLSRNTQANAATAEQLTVASAQSSREIERLHELVGACDQDPPGAAAPEPPDREYVGTVPGQNPTHTPAPRQQ